MKKIIILLLFLIISSPVFAEVLYHGYGTLNREPENYKTVMKFDYMGHAVIPYKIKIGDINYRIIREYSWKNQRISEIEEYKNGEYKTVAKFTYSTNDTIPYDIRVGNRHYKAFRDTYTKHTRISEIKEYKHGEYIPLIKFYYKYNSSKIPYKIQINNEMLYVTKDYVFQNRYNIKYIYGNISVLELYNLLKG